MKKIFIAVIMMANIMNMNIANAQEYDFNKQTFEGVLQSSRLREIEKANFSRTINWQNSDGTRSCLAPDGLKCGAGVGYTYSAGHGSPMVQLNIGMDAIPIPVGTEEVNGNLRQKVLRIPSFELYAALCEGMYGASAASAGEKYLCYEAALLMKFALLEDMNIRHRLNLIFGIGYTYAKDDHIEDFGQWVEKDTGNTYQLYDNVAHRGSGLFEAVGLGYSFRPFDKLGSRAELRVLATRKPQVEWTKTTPVWGFQAELVFHFGGKHFAPAK